MSQVKCGTGEVKADVWHDDDVFTRSKTRVHCNTTCNTHCNTPYNIVSQLDATCIMSTQHSTCTTMQCLYCKLEAWNQPCASTWYW